MRRHHCKISIQTCHSGADSKYILIHLHFLYADLTRRNDYCAVPALSQYFIYGCIALTHPLGVAQDDSSQQIAAAEWGPKIHIPIYSKVSSDVYLYQNGLPGFSLCRETSVWYCCFPAIHSWGYNAVGRVLQSQGGCETSLSRWQSLGCLEAPGIGWRRNSSTGEHSGRCKALGRQVLERSNGAPRRQEAAQWPRTAAVLLPSQPALKVQIDEGWQLADSLKK